MEKKSEKLHVAFLIDSLTLSPFMVDTISYVENHTELFAPPTLLVNVGITTPKQSWLIKWISRFIRLRKSCESVLTSLILAIEKRSRYGTLHTVENQVTLNRESYRVVELRPTLSKSKRYVHYEDEALAKIKAIQPDVLVRGGGGILRGGILHVAPFGILSFHHGDNRVYRGSAPGFWEAYEENDSIGFIIQRLTDELDGGEVLCRGNFPATPFWSSNYARVMTQANPYMAKLLHGLAATRQLPKPETGVVYGRRLYLAPTLLPLFRYFLRLIGRILKKPWNALTPPHNRWAVSYAYGGISTALYKTKTIENPPHRFLADPFVIENANEDFCFVEDYDARVGKAHISAIRFPSPDSEPEFLGVALDEPFHLSFPYVFKDGADFYMIPESCANRDIRLYKATDFPLRWELVKPLMTDVEAVDTVVFRSDLKWFLLTTFRQPGLEPVDAEFHLFSSDTLLGPWIPSKNNPLFIDSMRARNGGFFSLDGRFYRINQVPNRQLYGRSFVVNEVLSLNPNEYTEKPLFKVDPVFKKGILCTHHFHTNGRICVVDHAQPDNMD